MNKEELITVFRAVTPSPFVLVDRQPKKEELISVFQAVTPEPFVLVDDWIPKEEDEIFRHARAAIILNLAPLYGLDGEKEDINYFVMSSNRCYNATSVIKYKYYDTEEKKMKEKKFPVHSITKDVFLEYQQKYAAEGIEINKTPGFRDHFCHYMNYFEKFYDKNHWLVALYSRFKFMIDYKPGWKEYTREALINDLQRSIINYRNPDGSYNIFHMYVQKMVKENYIINQDYHDMENMCLAYNNFHTKILMEMSMLFDFGIPILSHYAFKRDYATPDVNNLFMDYFSRVIEMIVDKYNVDISTKLYETISTNVDKNKKRNPILWQMQDIRVINPTTLTMRLVEHILRQLVPKYEFDRSVISFNFRAILSELRYKITDTGYEFKLASVSSSQRDEDNNSAADKFEAHISKTNEAQLIQTNVNCDTTIDYLTRLYGPFNQDEINFYRHELSKDDHPIKNEYQETLIAYLFMKDFFDKGAITLVNYDDYIKLMLIAKRYLSSIGQVFLPYIISGRIERLVTKTNVNKKLRESIEASELWPLIQQKYNNPKIEDFVFCNIAKILASDFRVIDYNDPEVNGVRINPMEKQISEEFLQYVLII